MPKEPSVTFFATLLKVLNALSQDELSAGLLARLGHAGSARGRFRGL